MLHNQHPPPNICGICGTRGESIIRGLRLIARLYSSLGQNHKGFCTCVYVDNPAHVYNLHLLSYSAVGSYVLTTFRLSDVYSSDAVYSWEDGSTE